ncbi:MAG TPA: hypothetical protein PKC67_12740 [Kiritimatiellia bacterium]|nr:hypothetical protein [Kiritimatiellia bacterium]HMP35204.1 hypothetical protein [Kiritimatiellia bacterium]
MKTIDISAGLNNTGFRRMSDTYGPGVDKISPDPDKRRKVQYKFTGRTISFVKANGDRFSSR